MYAQQNVYPFDPEYELTSSLNAQGKGSFPLLVWKVRLKMKTVGDRVLIGKAWGCLSET